jgi:Cu-processing system permease protein
MGSGATARRIVAVAGLTFREALRRRVVLAAILMSLGFLALYGVGLHYAAKDLLSTGRMGVDELIQREAAAQMLYIGLFPTSFLVALTAVFAGAGTLSSEVDSGVIYGVLARPIRRGELVIGKFCGLAWMLAAYAAAFNGAVIGLAAWQIHVPVNQWAAALALLVLEPMPLLALTLAGSARLPTLANGILGVAFYGIGFVGGLIEQIGGLIRNSTLENLGIISSLLMPLDALHRKAVSLLLPGGLLFQQGGVPGMGGSTPSAWMVVYAMGYVVVMVVLAVRIFSRRDL